MEYTECSPEPERWIPSGSPAPAPMRTGCNPAGRRSKDGVWEHRRLHAPFSHECRCGRAEVAEASLSGSRILQGS